MRCFLFLLEIDVKMLLNFNFPLMKFRALKLLFDWFPFGYGYLKQVNSKFVELNQP